jgi:hypothetical protein
VVSAAVLVGASILIRVFFARFWPGVAENLGPVFPPALLDKLVDLKIMERVLLALGIVVGFFGFRELRGNAQRRLVIAIAQEMESRSSRE